MSAGTCSLKSRFNLVQLVVDMLHNLLCKKLNDKFIF